MENTKTDAAKWQQLADTVAILRGENGCPWDKEQDHVSLKRCLLEETYEVLDAIDEKDDAALCEELGDVLLQVVFHSQLSHERGGFDLNDVVEVVTDKMVRRHPHIFGDAHEDTAEGVLSRWEKIKAAEKKSVDKKAAGIMTVNDNLPALMLAQKVQDKAHRVGFDWDDIEGPRQKLREEVAELEAAGSKEEALDELGDVLFAAVNLARFYDVDAEDALRHTVKKFIRRFRYIEDALAAENRPWDSCTLQELDRYWDEAKAEERK